MSSRFTITFLDNTVNHIYKSIESVKSEFPNTQVFYHEKELMEYLEKHTVDVVLMNLDLNPNDAINVLREIRAKQTTPPPYVVIYTKKQDDFIQELAFNSGADSFISFHQKGTVLKLFIRNLLHRRPSPITHSNREVVIDHERYLIYRNGVPIQLPRKEFMLFELLYGSSDRFFSKTEIAGEIWKDEKIAGKRTIDVHIYNIRQYFGKNIIQSQKGKGYRINKRLIAALSATFLCLNVFL